MTPILFQRERVFVDPSCPEVSAKPWACPSVVEHTYTVDFAALAGGARQRTVSILAPPRVWFAPWLVWYSRLGSSSTRSTHREYPPVENGLATGSLRQGCLYGLLWGLLWSSAVRELTFFSSEPRPGDFFKIPKIISHPLKFGIIISHPLKFW